MLQHTIRHFEHNRRGVSSVIVVMLSLVLITIIVSNIVLWSHQMNQLDLERMQERLALTNVTRVNRTSWVAPDNEYTVITGSRLSGTYAATRVADNIGEAFREEKIQAFNPSSYVLGGETRYVSGTTSDMTSNDGSYMLFRSSPNYENRYQESSAISSTTNTNYQDKVSIDFSPQVTADFVIIATAEVQGSSTSYQAKARLTVDSATYQELAYGVKDSTDWYPFCGLKRLTLSENTNYNIKIQYSTSDSRGTASIRNAQIEMFSLQSHYAESESISTTGDTNWQDKVTLTFTPPSVGDYLLIATANFRMSSTNRDGKVRLIQDNTTVHTDILRRPRSSDTTEYYTFGMARKVTLDPAVHNFKIQYCSSGSPGTTAMKYAHIIAVELSQFDANSYAESENESGPSVGGAWYDKVVNSYTSEDTDYLIMGSISYSAGSTSNSIGLDFQTDSATKQMALVEHQASTDYESAFFITKQTLAQGSKIDRIRFMGENTNARVKNARLISCKLSPASQTVDVELVGNSNTQTWTQLDWTTDTAFTTSDVATTFQLFDHLLNDYPTSGDGFMSDTIGTADLTRNQTIAVNPDRFRNETGNWRVRVEGVKTTDIPFELKVDWCQFEVTTSSIYRLVVENSLTTEPGEYSSSYILGLELLLRYNTTSDSEKWFIRAYNWTASRFDDLDPEGDQPFVNQWNDYILNVTSSWTDYINEDGTLLLEFMDQGTSPDQSIVNIDFLGVRAIVDGVCFTLRNSGQFSAHIVAIWITNTTYHERYEANFFTNSGEIAEYIRTDFSLPNGDFTAKVVTERGNIAVFQ